MASKKQSLAPVCAAVVVFSLFLSASAMAQIGEPAPAYTGDTFGITISQGGTILLQDGSVPFPTNIKSSPSKVFLDDALNNWGNDIYLKIVSDGTADESFRVTHWYIGTEGSDSLFDPANCDPIDVEINGITFTNNAFVSPTLLDQDDYYVSYFMNEWGYFYQTPGTNNYNDYWGGKYDVQVPGNEYLDGTNPHAFEGNAGTVVSWTWKNITAPGTNTMAIDNSGVGHTSDFVQELGFSVSFATVPEPAGILFLAGGLLLVARRRWRV